MPDHSNPVKSNLVLIGMPGAGKSTVGVILAKQSRRQFLDTDLLIQTTRRQTLQEIVDAAGEQALRAIEEQVLVSLDCTEHVIATGGSAVYSDAGMARLAEQGRIIFLSVPLGTLTARLDNYATRGIARRPDQTLEELFAERQTLYQHYAELTVDCVDKSADRIAREILARLPPA